MSGLLRTDGGLLAAAHHLPLQELNENTVQLAVAVSAELCVSFRPLSSLKAY